MAFRILYFIYFCAVALNLGLGASEFSSFAENANQIEKVLLFLATVTFLFQRRIDLWVLAIVGLIALTTFVCAVLTTYPGFAFDRYFKSGFSLVTVLLLLAGVPEEKDRNFLIVMLALMPLACVGVGAIYHVLGIRPIVGVDFLGVTRLQGSSIPAGLAARCYVGVIAAMFGAALIWRRPFLLLAAVNFLILLLTAARMAFALTVMAGLVIYIWLLSRNFINLLLAGVASIPVVGFLAYLFSDSIIARFESSSLSGRQLIWDYLWTFVQRYPYFGIGLGHQINVLPPQISEKTGGTIAAHNEYLRLAVETGYVGVSIIFFLIIVIFIRLWLRPRINRSMVFAAICLSYLIYCTTDNPLGSGNTSLVLALASFSCSRFDLRGRPVAMVKRRYVVPPMARAMVARSQGATMAG